MSGADAVASPGTPAVPGYHEALRLLADRGRFGVRLGLGRVRALLAALDDPQLAVRGALVAGTNGKGSVIALAGSALRAAGYRLGETPKPHLVTYRERIVVDGRPIDAHAFASLVAEVVPVADRLSPRLGPPTEFELLTAMIFRHFADAGVGLALVEVGLGGRLDATHAWDGGVAVVTNVELDHMAYLGPTRAAIAREKAAIIERGDVAVTGATGDALAVVRRRARRLGVPLAVVEAPPLAGWDRDGITVELPGLGATRVGLRGRHQAANAAVANALLDALGAAGLAEVPADARRHGFATARWSGRLELVVAEGARGPVDVLLDGAHNEAGAAALAEALDDLRPFLAGAGPAPAPLTVVWATMADKDVPAVLGAVAACRALGGARVICTAVDAPRALEPDALAAAWARARPDLEVSVAEHPEAALDRALAEAPGPIVVAGSLYLVGAARARLVDDPVLRDPEPAGA